MGSWTLKSIPIYIAAAAAPPAQHTLDAGQAARPQPATEEVARLNICRNRSIFALIALRN